MTPERSANELAGGATVARNTFINLAGRAAPIVAALAVTPFVVRALGPERFGIFSLGWAVIGFFFIFDMGLGRAATKYVSDALARGREDRAAPVAWNAALIQLALGVSGSALMAVLTPTAVAHWLNIPPAHRAEAEASFYILAASMTPALLEYTFAGVLESLQRFDLINLVRAPLNVAALLGLLAVSVAGWSLAWFFALYLACRVLTLLLFFIFCARRFPGLVSLPRPDREAFAALFDFGKWITVSNLLNPVFLYFDRMYLGAVSTLSAVSHYTAPYQVADRLLILPSTLASTLFPALSSLQGRGATPEISRMGVRSVKLLGLAMGVVCVAAVGAANEVVFVLLGPEYLGKSGAVFQLLVVGFLLNSLAFIPYSILQARGRPDLTAKLHLAELPLHIGLLVGLTGPYGIYGVTAAWLGRIGFDLAGLTWLCLRTGSLVPADLARARLGGFSLALAAGLAAGAWLPWLDLGWTLRTALAAAASLGLFAWLWGANLDAEERDEIAAFARRATARLTGRRRGPDI